MEKKRCCFKETKRVDQDQDLEEADALLISDFPMFPFPLFKLCLCFCFFLFASIALFQCFLFLSKPPKKRTQQLKRPRCSCQIQYSLSLSLSGSLPIGCQIYHICSISNTIYTDHYRCLSIINNNNLYFKLMLLFIFKFKKRTQRDPIGINIS